VFSSQAYYNTNAVNLLRNILVGGVDLQLEEILAEGKRFKQCKTAEMLRKRKRARMAIVTIRDLIPNIDTRVQILSLSIIKEDNIFYLVFTSHIQFTFLRIT
jgi:hypothetical protein